MKKLITKGFLTFSFFITIISAFSQIDLNKIIIVGLPRPNSGKFTYEEAEKRKHEIFDIALTKKYFDWKNPTSGGAIHINAKDEIEIYQFTIGIFSHQNDSGVHYIRAPKDTSIIVNKSEIWNNVSGIGYGNETSVLITSEIDLKKSKAFKEVMSVLWQPAVQIYYFIKKEHRYDFRRDEATRQIIRQKSLGNFVFKDARIGGVNLFDTAEVYRNAKEDSTEVLVPHEIIVELLSKAENQVGTVEWNRETMPNRILIDDYYKELEPTEVLKQLSVSKKSENGKIVEELIAIWNDPSKHKDLSVSSVSYPIFDKTGEYMIMEHGYSRGPLSGRSWIYIYKFDGNSWVEVLRVHNYIS